MRIQKILSPLLFLPVFLPVIFSFLLAAKRAGLKKEIKEKMEYGILHTIRLKHNEFAWIKPGKEIVISGRMFDVKNQITKGDETEFIGLFDEEETALNAITDNLWKRQVHKNNMLLSQLAQMLQGVYFPPTTFFIVPITEKQVFGAAPFRKLSPVFSSVTTPPPRC